MVSWADHIRHIVVPNHSLAAKWPRDGRSSHFGQSALTFAFSEGRPNIRLAKLNRISLALTKPFLFGVIQDDPLNSRQSDPNQGFLDSALQLCSHLTVQGWRFKDPQMRPNLMPVLDPNTIADLSTTINACILQRRFARPKKFSLESPQIHNFAHPRYSTDEPASIARRWAKPATRHSPTSRYHFIDRRLFVGRHRVLAEVSSISCRKQGAT